MGKAENRRSAGQPKQPRDKHRRRTLPGAAPGTLTADPHATHPQIQMITFGPDGLREKQSATLSDLTQPVAETAVRWVNVDGLGDIPTLQNIGETFGLHPLALEDIVNLHQRPKVEAYDTYLFIVLRMPVASVARLETEQVTMALGRKYVLTFLERQGDSFDPVRHRLRNTSGQIRNRGAHYLAYALCCPKP